MTRPEYVEGRIERRLAEDPAVAELGIQVVVRPPTVVLRGRVPSPARRDRIAEVVRDLVPDHEVRNEIEVTGTGEPDGTEDLREDGR